MPQNDTFMTPAFLYDKLTFTAGLRGTQTDSVDVVHGPLPFGKEFFKRCQPLPG